MTLDSPRVWYVLWWSAWTVGAVLLAYGVLVRPITRRLDALLQVMGR